MAKGSSAPARVYRGQVPAERRAERRARLLEAGLDLLATSGFQATTVTAVCERARLTPRYFYESFRDRDALLVAIFDAIVDDVVQQARARTGSRRATALDTARTNIEAWVEVVSDDPRKGRVAFVEALGSEALMRRRLDATRGFAEILSDRADAPGEVATRFVAGGLIETMIEWLEGGLERSGDELVEDFTAVAATVLRPRASTSARRARPRGSA